MAEKNNYTCRDCEGFVPTAISLPQQDGRTVPYLPVSERILWFNQWCSENTKSGRITVEVTPMELWRMPYIKAESTIFIGEALMASDVVIRSVQNGQEPLYYDNVVQRATTAAKGRALANLGFNIPGGIEEEPEQQQESKSPDSIPKAPADAQNAQPTSASDGYLPARVGFGTESGEKDADAPTPGDKQAQQMTLEQAQSVLVEYGRLKEQRFTVGQLLTMDACAETLQRTGRQWLEFFAAYGPYEASGGAKISGKMPTLYRASRLVLDAAEATN